VWFGSTGTLWAGGRSVRPPARGAAKAGANLRVRVEHPDAEGRQVLWSVAEQKEGQRKVDVKSWRNVG
jgi:hypothetical protein